LKLIHEICFPNRDVLKGDLGDALFGADVGHVAGDRTNSDERWYELIGADKRQR